MRNSLLFSFFILFSVVAYGQHKEENIIITDSPTTYLFSGFREATILLKTGSTSRGSFNYNTLTEEMVFEKYGKLMALDMPGIDTIYIGGQKFIPFDKAFFEVETTPSGSLYIRHQVMAIQKGKPIGYGSYTQDGATNSLNALSAAGSYYQLKVPADFKVHNISSFWIKKESQFHEINNARQLKSAFPEKKTFIKKFLKENEIDFDDVTDVRRLLQVLQ